MQIITIFLLKRNVIQNVLSLSTLNINTMQLKSVYLIELNYISFLPKLFHFVCLRNVLDVNNIYLHSILHGLIGLQRPKRYKGFFNE